jgi:Fe2+ transport system protein B
MEDEKFSPSESLQLIQSMIDKTKKSLSSDSHYFLLWGWLTFAACTGQFVLKHFVNYEKHYLVWWVTFIGVVGTIYFSIRDAKARKVKSYIDEMMMHLWIGMGITFFIISMIFGKIGWGTTVFPFFKVLYGLGTFVSGSVIKFKPLIIGGIISWILAVVAVFLSYDYQILMGALAILFSYIIPGHLLRNKK